jgi:hypothetical protein
MELHPKDRSPFMLERADRIAVALGGDTVALWRLFDMIAMTHPGGDGLIWVEPGKESGWLHYLHLRPAVLPPVGADDFSALDVRNELHPIADA